MYDLVIIGGGPAGATLARLASDLGRVLVIEKRPATADPHSPHWLKPCGGMLVPEGVEALSRMGLSIPQEVLVRPQPLRVRLVDFGSGRQRYYSNIMCRNVDRGRLDQWLLSLVPPGVEVQYDARLRRLELGESSVTVHYRLGRAELSVEARAVVGADGAASRTRRCIVPRRSAPRAYLTMQDWVANANQAPLFTAIFDTEITDFYCWTVPKDDRLIIGAALRAQDEPARRFELFRQRLAERLGVTGRSERRETALLLRPTSMRQLCLGHGRVLLVGEAAGLTSPTSGEGMSFALRSAQVAARALRSRPDDPLRAYRRSMRRTRATLMAKLLKSRALYSPMLRRLLMHLGIMAVPPPGAGEQRPR